MCWSGVRLEVCCAKFQCNLRRRRARRQQRRRVSQFRTLATVSKGGSQACSLSVDLGAAAAARGADTRVTLPAGRPERRWSSRMDRGRRGRAAAVPTCRGDLRGRSPIAGLLRTAVGARVSLLWSPPRARSWCGVERCRGFPFWRIPDRPRAARWCGRRRRWRYGDIADTMAKPAARQGTTSLRVFLRYLAVEGRCRAGLANVVPGYVH